MLGCDLSEAGFTDESFALNQHSRHAVALSEVCGDYPFERVYEQVVYVGTDSFSTDCREFVGLDAEFFGGCIDKFVNDKVVRLFILENLKQRPAYFLTAGDGHYLFHLSFKF